MDLLAWLVSSLRIWVPGVLLYAFCNIFLFDPVGKIRGWLAKTKSGRLRKRYIRIFIGAVRGEAAVFETIVVALLIALAPFLMAFWSFSNAVDTDRDRQELQRTIDFYTALRRGEIEITREKLLSALDAEREQLFKRLEQGAFRRYLLGIGCGLLGVYALFVWYPYVVILKGFDYELTRFMLRIQGLASKAELADLAVAEGRVTNEQNLRAFVDTVKAIAERHGVPQLASTFDLWKNEKV